MVKVKLKVVVVFVIDCGDIVFVGVVFVVVLVVV